MNDILYGCAEEPENIENPNFDILTFNYDVSLDFYLKNSLSNIEILLKRYPEKEFLDKFNIFHIYGSIHGDSEYQYGEYYPKIKGNIALNNTKAFEKSYINRSNILTMYEDRISMDKIDHYIKNAEEIIIIGFGFDRSNLDILGFPSSIKASKNYKHIFSGKTIKYLNYGGSMTNIDDEFEIISKSFAEAIKIEPVKIVRSHARKVTDAYFRDFKPSLLTD